MRVAPASTVTHRRLHHAGLHHGMSPTSHATSELLGELDEAAATRPVLRSELADPGAAAQEIDAIEEVDGAQAQRERLAIVVPGIEVPSDRRVPLRVLGCVLQVGKAGAQPAAVDAVRAGEHVFKAIGST